MIQKRNILFLQKYSVYFFYSIFTRECYIISRGWVKQILLLGFGPGIQDLDVLTPDPA